MNKILWTQNESPLYPDTIFVDENICNDAQECQKAFNLLNKLNQQLALDPKKRDWLYKKFKNRGFSHQANYQVDLPGIYLQGCFLNKDNVGRKLPYMYYDAQAVGIADAAESLKMIAACIGRKCNDNEIKILESESKKKRFLAHRINDNCLDSNIDNPYIIKLKLWSCINQKKM